jgi:phage/plasmid-associated DNA primase
MTALDTLKMFMTAHMCDSKEIKPTHVAFGKFNGCYNITKDDYEEFMDLYCSVVAAGEKVTVLECIPEYAPIIVDVDIKIESDEKLASNIERAYTIKDIKKLIKIYKAALIKLFGVKDTDFYVFEKPEITQKKDNFVDGFHMVIPICLSKLSRKNLRNYIIDQCIENDLFTNFNDDIKTILDGTFSNWFLYGGSKPDANVKPYTLTHMFDWSMSEYDIAGLNIRDLINTLAIRTPGEYTKKTESKPINASFETESKQSPVHAAKDVGSSPAPSVESSLAPTINALVSLLSDSRACDYGFWLNCLCAIKTETNSEDIARDFSMRCPSKFDEAAFKRTWKSLATKGSLTIRTLCHYAKEDNPKGFAEWQKIYYKPFNNVFFQQMQTPTHNILASIYYNRHPDDYVYTVRNKEVFWYSYDQYNKLVSEGSDVPTSLFNNVAEEIQQIIKDEHVLVPTAEYAEAGKIASRAIAYVGDAKNTTGIIKFLRDKYRKNYFQDEVDNNINLLAFNDKVYDYNLRVFRDINRCDKILKTVKYDMPARNDKIKKKINDIIFSVFEDVEVAKYFLESTGLCLFDNSKGYFYIHNGRGGNGKSLLSSMIGDALGEYFRQVESTFFTGKDKTGAPNSTKAQLPGVRFVLCSEPEDGGLGELKLNMNLMKEASGGGIITTRELNGKSFSYKPQFTAHIQTNTMPTLGKVMPADRRRAKSFNYKLTFKSKPNTKNPVERQADTSFPALLATPAYYQEFLMMLIDAAVGIKFEKGFLNEPEHIKKETEEFFFDNDVFAQATDLIFLITNNDKDIVEKDRLYDRFKMYFKNMTDRAICDLMKDNGFKAVRQTTGQRKYIYKGLQLVDLPVVVIKEESDKSDTGGLDD